MHSQSMIAYREPLIARDSEMPAPEGSEVVVRIRHCGVCHSDLHMHDGCFHMGDGKELDVRAGRSLPFILGHEIEGEVSATGPDATGIDIGAHKVIYPWIGCGSCAVCGRGDELFCERPAHLGINVDGGYATHVKIPHPRYLLDANGIDPAFAAACMCSGLTAYSALKKLSEAIARGPLLIVGLGGVGMMAVQFAKAMFDTPILVADIDEGKRERALQMGAEAAFDPADRESKRTLIKQTNGAAAAADFAGAESSFVFAQGSLRKGGHLVVAGLIGGSFSMSLPLLPLRAIKIEGSFVGTLAEAHETLKLVRDAKIAPIPIETRPLTEANRALDDLRAGSIVGRVVLAP